MKLTVLSGLPASGKTTKAQEVIEKTGNTVRVNRDLLRTMLHFDKWSGRHEEMTINAEIALAQFFLSQCNVIIDDCNLNPKNIERWKAFASTVPGCRFEYIRIETPLNDCLLRNTKRSNDGDKKWISEHVIFNMALKYGLAPKPLKGYILCDIDGTLANIDHRLQYAKGETKNWKKFFELIQFDKIRSDVSSMIRKYSKEEYDIIFMSARPDTYKHETLIWLARHNFWPNTSDYRTLIMRKGNDKRPDTEVKKQMLETYFPDKSLIHKIIDDRPSVIRMWRELGLDVIDVGKGIEF